MEENFSTYRKFIYKDDALDLIEILKQNQIDYVLNDNSSRLDSTFGNDDNSKQFELKINKNDFDKVENLEENLIIESLNNVENDHYLFEYSDEELMEIVITKEQWSKYDYLLAKKILREKGKEINPELLNVIEKERTEKFSKQEDLPKMWIFFGYFFAIIGGFIGVMIGYTIMSYKRNLPDGSTIYLYKKEDRIKGQNILILSIIGIVFWITMRLLNKN